MASAISASIPSLKATSLRVTSALAKAAILGLEAGEGTGKRKVKGGPLWSVGLEG